MVERNIRKINIDCIINMLDEQIFIDSKKSEDIMENIIKNKDLVLSWLEDDESRFIFERRYKYTIDSLKNNKWWQVSNCSSEKLNDFDYMFEMIKSYLLKYDETKKMLDKSNMYIYGAGQRWKIFRKAIGFIPSIDIKGIIDGSPEKIGTVDEYLGIKISSPSEVDFSKIDCLVITVKSEKMIKEIKEKIISLGVKEENIIILSELIDNYQYFDEVINFEEEETFIDVGVFDLTTTLKFFDYCNKNNVRKAKSIAFEPDNIAYENCKKIKSEHPDYDIELLKYGLYSENTTLKFVETANSASFISEKDGTVSIDVVALDNVVDEKVTFIKMDVEGAELEALKGAAETIKKYRPKLAISVYHKPEDIIEIPMYIKSLVPEYKLYMRHYSWGEHETVLYALPY